MIHDQPMACDDERRLSKLKNETCFFMFIAVAFCSVNQHGIYVCSKNNLPLLFGPHHTQFEECDKELAHLAGNLV